VGLHTARDWALRFNRHGHDGLIDGKAPGGCPRHNAKQRVTLAAVVESGPIHAAHGVVLWRLVDLVQWIRDELAVSISTQTLSRELRAMGYRKLTARPCHHAQDADAIPTLKKLPRPSDSKPGDAARGTPIEFWWQDEARVAQKNGITRRWAKRGRRPSAPKD
jgi:transposase